MRHVARRFPPSLCHCRSHARAGCFISRPRQAQADGVGLGKIFRNALEQSQKLAVIQQSHIARAELAPLYFPSERVSEQRRGARAAALNAEGERTSECAGISHAAVCARAWSRGKPMVPETLE